MFDKKAYTLSEVLICISIIGVLAATTIPVVNMNAHERQLEAARKKAFIIATDAWEYAVERSLINDEDMENNFKYFSEYFSKAQDGIKSGTNTFVDKSGFKWYLSAGKDKIIVDINGAKGPNVLNKDQIEFCVDANSLIECVEPKEENNE